MKLAPFTLERYFARYEFKVRYLLSSSDCESFSIQDILNLEPGSAEKFSKHWLGYTESEGSPELRAEIAHTYNNIDANQVLTFAGAEEAIFAFMNIALERGDHVIIHSPCYQSLIEIPTAIGCEVTHWQASEENAWALDIDFLKRSIRPTTKAIVINCPHNPTGYLMSHDNYRELINIARQHDLILFSDEVYRFLEYDPADRLPAACDLYENAVSLGVMSKAYGLAGLRIGWIATQNSTIHQQMAAFKDYTTICNSAPSEFLSVIALRHRETLVKRNLGIIHDNLTMLDNFFAQHQDVFHWQKPRAGAIAFPRLKLDQSVDMFCADVVEKKGVMLLPGTCYTPNSSNFRIGFGRASMPESLQQLDEYLREYIS
jgi:aspartate/methionine/tyrosine aminotransferase